ncbi:ninein-like protein-like, partial [Scleropages formosus]
VPEEVKPKFVKGTKRYGRRTRPDRPDPELGVRLEGTSSLRTDQVKSSPVDEQRTKLRRSTSLESVESLKSDDGAGSNKESSPHTFEAQDLQSDGSDQQMQALWANLGVGGSSFLNRQELSLVCESIGLKDLPTELDQDQDGRVSLKEFQRGFLTHGILPRPSSCSTPIHPHPHPLHSQSFADSPVRSASRSLLSATVGQRLLTRLDDGSGCGSPECVVALWNEEGVRNSQEILQTLEFSLEEKLSLAELSLALDNELLVSGNSIHQAALVSYKNEIQFLQVQADQARRERDKAKLDLERAEQRNLYLVREVDDRHTTMESFNETRIRGLEQEYRDKLMSLRTESEMEREVLLQQAEQERTRLQREVDSLRVKEVNLQEEVSAANEENSRLEKEVSLLRGRLSDSETTISRLQKDLDHLLLDKLGLLDTGHEGLLGQEERFADIIREYEQQCRPGLGEKEKDYMELRDRNDELNSELEVLKSQGLGTRSRKDRILTGAWPSLQEQMTESDSDDPEKKKKGAPLITRKKLPVTNTDALGSLESLPGNMSINSELFVELLKEKHNQEVQELKIDLETKVNFYERSLELMRRNMEVERKDISQGFKLEISELEEQKALAEEREARLRESLVQLQAQFQASAWGPEQEKRAQRERAELEQNYAREISNLVQKLTSEKEQLEAELKLKMDQEVQLVREEVKQQLARAMPQYTEVQCTLQEQEAWEQELEAQGSQEWKRLEDAHKNEAWSLQDKIRTLESQGAKVKVHSRDLEVELKKRHSQSIECVASLKSQETLLQCLATGMCTKEELEVMKMQENTLLCKLSELASELRITNGEYETLLKEVREEEDKLEEMQEVLRSSEASLLKKATELKSIEEEKAKLEEGLERQSAAPEKLQTFNYQKDHLIHRRNSEERLMDPLRQEKSKVEHMHPILCSEREQGVGTLQRNSQDTCLTVQLSFQIQELEVELSKLRRVIQDLSFCFNFKNKFVLALQVQLETEAAERGHLMNNVTQTKNMLEHQEELCKDLANKVQLLTIQLEDKERALCAQMQQSGHSCSILQKALQEAQAQTRCVEEEFEREKNRMREQLQDMEKLVMAVEAAMDQSSPHRRQLTEVTTENTVLKNRHSRVQQDIERLEDEVSKKRLCENAGKAAARKLPHDAVNVMLVARIKTRMNARHREEVLELSGRNLELSGENAELMRSLRSDQEAVRLLTERLEQLSQEREEELVAVSELRESLNRQEREKEQLEHKLGAAKEKLHQLSAAEAELSGLTLKYRWQEEEKKRLLKEADERTLKVEQLQESLCSLNTQTEQLRSQLHAANLDKALQAQEATTCQKTLQEFEDKVQELESTVERMRQGKEQLRVAHQQQQQMEEEEAEALRRECQSLRSQNQELFCKVSQLKVQESEVHKVNQESHTLKTKQAKLEMDVQQAQEQRLQADTALALAQSQHARELQQLREQLDQGWRERLCQIEARLAEEHRRVEQLEGQLNHQAHQASTHMGLQQEQYEKAMKWMEEKMEEADAKVKNLRMVLQEKVIQLKEQLSKNAKLDVLLKDLYVENSQLMKAVQVTEQWQKCAERKNYILEEKIAALNILLRKIAPASLSV